MVVIPLLSSDVFSANVVFLKQKGEQLGYHYVLQAEKTSLYTVYVA